jgi:outer membrane lipoprotein carrier protein
MRKLFFAAFCFFSGELASAQLAGLAGKAKVDAFLKEMAKAQAAVRTLAAEFRQTKVSRLLQQPSVATGTFYFAAPDQVRWDYKEPRPMVVLMTSKAMVTYKPAERQAERVELGRNQRKVFSFLSATEPLAGLSRHFSFALRDAGEGSNYVLVLTPVTHAIKKRLRSVELAVNRKTFLPVKVTYTEADGDVTSYEFSHIVINGSLPEGIFALELPPGVKLTELKLRGSE